MDQAASSPAPTPANPERREFLLKTCTLAAGGAAVIPAILGGAAVALDPLARAKGGGDAALVRVTGLEALPADGVPRKFSVLADRVDAWNKYPRSPVGAVYLRRTENGEVTAWNSTCPHAGCFVDFVPADNHFWCPCHNSAFRIDGTIENPASPAARPLDSLQTEIRNKNEVWVRFQNFRTGTSEKIPT